jgi:hypothetical protein
MIRLAIQPDKLRLSSRKTQSYSERWHELAGKWDFEARHVDVYANDFFDQVADCDGFLWWFGQPSHMIEPGRRIVAALRHARPALAVFPNWEMAWHFDDKAAQASLLMALDVPMPKTQVFWTRDAARAFAVEARYPLVLKLASGLTSRNVALIADVRTAMRWIDRLFGRGVYDLGAAGATAGGGAAPRWRRLRTLVRRAVVGLNPFERLHHGCILLQEFVPGNSYDTRITVIGNRAFAFRRHNRPGDFRASGSGRVDWDVTPIAEDAIDLAFRVARAIRGQSVAVDVLRRDGRPIVTEVSYYYEGWVVAGCPGHWTQRGTGGLAFVEGAMRPEDAILEDFLNTVHVVRDARPAPERRVG